MFYYSFIILVMGKFFKWDIFNYGFGNGNFGNNIDNYC